MTDREHRLRLRIDQLLDEREHLQTLLTGYQHRHTRLSDRAYKQRRRAELWRQRALSKRAA